MTISNYITAGILASSLYGSSTFCNPASTEYVKTSIEALRSELTSQIKAMPTVQIHHIGEIFQGGLVFWVDTSQQHGLIVSLKDITTEEGIAWRNGEGGDRIVNAQAQGLGAGETNTRLIIAEQTIDQQEGQFAAKLTANYQVESDGQPCTTPLTPTAACYGGWYLPSLYELMLLYQNLKMTHVGHLNDGAYWSSSEQDTTQAWLIDFATGEVCIRDKSTPARVRAIRSF